MSTLEEFCEISRFKINAQKSKVFVSSNIDRRVARDLSAKCGIPLTSDLGKYLGVPLMHGRVTRGHFNHIIEKMQKNLAGWKTKVLSIAGRTTLIQAESIKFILDYSRDIDLAFNASITTPRPALRLINSVLPSAGKTKLNIDGSRRMRVGRGFGGVFRDERGSWICGYYDKIDSGTSLEVVQLMEEDTTNKFPFKGLLEDAKIISRGCECTIQHVYKEGNLCADALAKLGAAQPKEMLVVNEPPIEIRS
ncbi:hypothetical protein ACSBR2_012110 [Camellia fascicularis]